MAQAGENLDRVMNRYAQVTEDYERVNGFAYESIARRILRLGI